MTPSRPEVRDWLDRTLVALIFIAANAALLATAPVHNDFWWSDAPRHALNGAFVKDFIAAAPLHDPKTWAIDYYLQYPALSILFYPPLFYFFEAAVFAVFGVSQFAAQATVALFTFALGAATYGLVRFNFPRWSALGASLLVIGGPEIAFWARQVMLDVPAYAAIVTAVYFHVRYLRSEQPSSLYLALGAVLAAVYLKLTAIFIIPVLAAHLIFVKGPRIMRDRHAVTVALLGVLGLIPAVLLTIKFGAMNVQSVSGRSDDLPRTSIAAWLFYAKLFPAYLGYVGAALGICGLVLVLRRKTAPLEARIASLFVLWLVVDYLFFSLIGVREPRHGITMAFPLVIFAVVLVHRVAPRWLAPAAVACLGLGTFVYSLVFDVPARISGYGRVADYVARHAPKNGVVLFSGYRDGNFIFALRTHEERRDLSTIRVDKVLLRVPVGERERGVGQANLDEHQISQAIRDYGVSLIVSQPGFWKELREMARFEKMLATPDFRQIAAFDISGTVPHVDNRITVYEPTYPIKQNRSSIRLEMPDIGGNFEGGIGKSNGRPH